MEIEKINETTNECENSEETNWFYWDRVWTFAIWSRNKCKNVHKGSRGPGLQSPADRTNLRDVWTVSLVANLHISNSERWR